MGFPQGWFFQYCFCQFYILLAERIPAIDCINWTTFAHSGGLLSLYICWWLLQSSVRVHHYWHGMCTKCKRTCLSVLLLHFCSRNDSLIDQLLSVLWCCWLVSRKVIWPVKTEWWGAGMVICLGRDADLHMAQQMPLPLSLASVKSRLVLVVAHPSNPGQSPEGCKMDVYVLKNLIFNGLL